MCTYIFCILKENSNSKLLHVLKKIMLNLCGQFGISVVSENWLRRRVIYIISDHIDISYNLNPCELGKLSLKKIELPFLRCDTRGSNCPIKFNISFLESSYECEFNSIHIKYYLLVHVRYRNIF